MSIIFDTLSKIRKLHKMHKMNIYDKILIGGISITRIKELLKAFQACPLTIHNIQDFLKVDRQKAETVLKEMVHLGYLQAHPTINATWQNAVRGNWLITKPISHLLSTEKAIKNKALIEERIKEVNNDNLYLYKVEQYSIEFIAADIPNTYRYIQLALILTPKENNESKLVHLEDEKRASSEYSFFGMAAYWQYPKMEVIYYIKKGLHNLKVIHPYLQKIKFGRYITPFDEWGLEK